MKSFDVVIAGGGVIGGAIAFELAGEGLRVCLVDRQEPGREASWASAGILSPAPEHRGMIPLVPLGKASMDLYPRFVAEVEEVSGQSAGFRPKGTLQAILSRNAREELSTLVALHRGLGLACEPLRIEEALEMEPSLSRDIEAAALRPDEASVDSRALTAAVLEAARRREVEIFPGTEVKAVWIEGARCHGLLTSQGKIAGGHTVIAAGAFSAGIEGVAPFAAVRPMKGQILALRAAGVRIERVLWSERIYLVPRNDGRIIAGATVEDTGFEKSLTAEGIHYLLDAAIELAPTVRSAEIVEVWAGLRPDSADNLPILGPTGIEGLLIATGHFRSGILMTPVTARLLHEWIVDGRTSLDVERFSPLRFQNAAGAAASFKP